MREASRQHEGQPCKRLRQRVFRCGLHVVFQRHAVFAQPLDHGHVVGRAEEQVHASRNLRTHAFDRSELLLACRHERIDRGERRSERFRHRLSHMANPQTEQRPGERARTALVNRRHELLRHGLTQTDWRAVLVHAPHIEHRKLDHIERVIVGDVGHAAALDKAPDDFLAHAVDVHSAAARPMNEALGRLNWAINRNAAVVDFALLAHDGALAARAHARHLPRLCIGRTKGKHGP